MQKLEENDRLTLEIAKLNRKVALAEAQTALAKNEASELSFKYTVLQIYRKYNLNDTDIIDENGNIVQKDGEPNE